MKIDPTEVSPDLASAAGPPAAALLPPNVKQRRGSFVFDFVTYNGPGNPYGSARVTAYTKFNLIVPGEILPAAEIATLKAAGCKLFFYDWLAAFYPTQVVANSNTNWAWDASVVQNHPGWLLGGAAPLPGGSGGGPAHFFNFAPVSAANWANSMQKSRAVNLAALVKNHHYDGVFLDLCHFTSVTDAGPAGLTTAAGAAYKALHPPPAGTLAAQFDFLADQYEQGVGQFLAELKNQGVLVMTNQGYRDTRHNPGAGTPTYKYYYSHIDYDVSESSMTTFGAKQVAVPGTGHQGSNTAYDRWVNDGQDTGGPLAQVGPDSVGYVGCNDVNKNALSVNPNVQVLYLNYADTRWTQADGAWSPHFDREALYYGAAAAALLGAPSFTSAPDPINPGTFGRPMLPFDDIYIVDLGSPLNNGLHYQVLDVFNDNGRWLAHRMFSNGIAVVNDTNLPQVLPIPRASIPAGVTGLWDVFSGTQAAAVGAAPIINLNIPVNHYPLPIPNTAANRPLGRIFAYMH